MVSRRNFLAVAGAAAAGLAAGYRTATAATSASTEKPDQLGRLGVGLFTLPKALEQDFDGTLAMIAGLGYREVELFGPYPFSVPAAQAGWRGAAASIGLPPNSSGFFGRTTSPKRSSRLRPRISSRRCCGRRSTRPNPSRRPRRLASDRTESNARSAGAEWASCTSPSAMTRRFGSVWR